MAKLQVFTLDNLTLYDELIKGYVDAADTKSLKTVAIDGNTLKFYKVAEPVGETAPAYEITLPSTDISGLIAKMTGATAGNVVIANADGTVADGGVALADLATTEALGTVEKKADDNATAITAINHADTGILAQAKAYTDEEVKELADGAVKTNTDAIAKLNGDATTEGSVAKAVKDSADAINAVIGTVEEGKTVVGMIEDVIANGYDDTEVRELISDNADVISALDTEVGDLTTLKTTEKATVVGAINEVSDAVNAHKTAIDSTVTTLVGDDTGKSVRTIANEELAAQLIGENAKESLDTLEEIAAWIQSHPDDASAMNKAIEDLEALVGTLPEGVTATTVVGYVQELVNAEKTRAEGVESGLDTRLKAVEEAVGEGGSIDTQITNAIADLDADVTSAAVEAGKGVQVQVVEVDGKVTTVAVTGNYDNTYDAKGAADTALGSAKTYADGLNTAMDTRVTTLEGLVGEGYESIPEASIRSLFTV